MSTFLDVKRVAARINDMGMFGSESKYISLMQKVTGDESLSKYLSSDLGSDLPPEIQEAFDEYVSTIPKHIKASLNLDLSVEDSGNSGDKNNYGANEQFQN